ncbi:MAG: lipoyl synthase [Planctomycetota bacterium]
MANQLRPGRFAKAGPTRKPEWLRMELPRGESFLAIRALLRERGLHTVCEEARCPNLGECWGGGTATMMVLGEVCTRACRFCHVKTGNPRGLVDADEPRKVGEACALMGLRYVVLTSVDRDDLEDGGAAHFAACVREAKVAVPGILVETLVPDFRGDREAVRTIVGSGIDVFAQNLETVERLTHPVRDWRAGYRQTLDVLRAAKELRPDLVTKSSLMLGLGETERELDKAFADLREAGVEVLTLGQYLRPTLAHLPVLDYVSPARFAALGRRAEAMGFAYVASGPLVRSSYKAAEHWAASRLGAAGDRATRTSDAPAGAADDGERPWETS